MHHQTTLFVCFVITFTLMSVIFALAGIGAYINTNRGIWDRRFSLCLGLLCSIGFARMAIESAGQI